MQNFYSFDEYTIPFGIKALYWGLYMGVFVFAAWKLLLPTTKRKQQKDATILFVVFFALYAVFYCINDDYFSYRKWINVTDIGSWHKEMFYIYLVLFCRSLHFEYPYEVFRLIVWGGGVFIAFQTYRMYRRLLLPSLTLLLLFVFHANTFCYARASLAMALYFLGIAFYLLHKGMNSKLLGIGIALSSYYFHRELLIGIAVLPFLFIPIERKSLSFFFVLLLPLAIIALSSVSSNIEFLDQMFDNDVLVSQIENYNEKEQGAFRLSTFFNYLKYFYSFYIVSLYFWKKKVSHPLKGIYRVTYGILMSSIAFMIVFGLRSIYTYRVLYISMIPLTLMISFGYYKGYITKKQLLIVMIMAMLNNSVHFINSL